MPTVDGRLILQCAEAVLLHLAYAGRSGDWADDSRGPAQVLRASVQARDQECEGHQP